MQYEYHGVTTKSPTSIYTKKSLDQVLICNINANIY